MPPPPVIPPTVDLNALARDLSTPPNWRIDPATGQAVNVGGSNAGMMDAAVAEWYATGGMRGVSPDQRRAAEIMKDAWARAAQSFRSGTSPSRYAAPSYYTAPMAGAVPGQLGVGAPPTVGVPPTAEFNPWQFNPLQGDWSQSVRQFNVPDLSWRGIPEQQRQPLANWFGSQGFKPEGSLGQFQYRSWASQNPYTFDTAAFDRIPDASLREWAKALFGQAAAPATQ